MYNLTTAMSLIDLKKELSIPTSDMFITDANNTNVGKNSGKEHTDTMEDRDTIEDVDTIEDKDLIDDLHLSESSLVVDLHTLEETPILRNEKVVVQNMIMEKSKDHRINMPANAKENEIPEIHPVIHIFENSQEEAENIDIEEDFTHVLSDKTTSQPERSPKLINSRGSLSQLGEHSTVLASLKAPDNEVAEGQNQEEHPGQYHELHPGQYHELHPGQYHETKQQEEKVPDNLGVENVTVDFEHGHESRIYNVQANAGDFIIGEVGKIDIHSGQTLQGVRYTALEGEVDEAQILDILEKYFGARTR